MIKQALRKAGESKGESFFADPTVDKDAFDTELKHLATDPDSKIKALDYLNKVRKLEDTKAGLSEQKADALMKRLLNR